MTSDAKNDDATWPCSVCGEPAGPEARSDCYRCGEYFHLRLTTTATGPDCGDVWIDDEVMALQFACRNCLAEQAGAQPTAPEEPSDPSPPVDHSPRRRAQRASGATSARDIARRRR